MASSQAVPEPMNSSPHHPKVKLTTTLADPTFVAGEHVSGKLEMECRADRGLGIGIMMVELFAVQELTSRDHSATSTFIHSRRLFQGPGLPPSNAVQAHPMPGDPPLPQHYFQARRGRSTFLFRIPIPASSPSSISFGSGLAKVRYEVRASVGVFWKNEKRLVVDKHSVDVVEAYPDDAYLGRVPEAVVVGESGKLWMQGRMTSGVALAGGSACLELQVKNHSSKKNTGLTLAVTRTLYLPGGHPQAALVQISDTLTTVPFRGPEYIVPPGAEGVANLVFDVPKYARSVRGGTLDGEESEGGPRHSDSLFEIRCKVEVKLSLGMGSKDLLLEVPIDIVHPKALPPPQDFPSPYAQPYPMAEPVYSDYNSYYSPPPISPAPLHMPYIDPNQNQVWLPPPSIPIQGYPYYQPAQQPYYNSQEQPNLFVPMNGAPHISRPLSAGPVASASQMPPPVVPGLPNPYVSFPLLPLHGPTHPPDLMPQNYEPEEGKGERARRVSQHLRMLSRNRSVSPRSHRYPLPAPPLTMLDDTASASIPIPAQRRGARLPPPPPLLLRQDNLSTSPASGGSDGVVHSPRPQLTPKHSFTQDPVLGATVKSERVEELEKMADAVAKKSEDLSNDLPKGIMATLEAAAAEEKEGNEKSLEKPSEDADVNKTLPGPPIPSGKQKDLLGLPSRARADLYFAAPSQGKQEPPMKETSPLPSDQTPPTPALVAVPSRRNEFLKTESGLDALERRLLAEVGTRNFDIRHHAARDQRPDVRSVLPIDTALERPSQPIPIPIKSPEPLNDSAISSLTLAGGLGGGDDSDGDFDGRTHRAGGRSRSPSGDEREAVLAVSSLGMSPDLGSGGRLHMHMHMRERAEGSTPTKSSKKERVKATDDTEAKTDREKEKAKEKEGKTSGKKKDRSSNKFTAKGRVAAWLGGIEPDVPPQEQIIPPSPSVVRGPGHPLAPLDDGPEEDNFPSPLLPTAPPESRIELEREPELPKDVSASPNPRSSGFVPIATLKRDTIQARPLITRDATVVEEARKVQDLWSSSQAPLAPPGLSATAQEENEPSTPTLPAQAPGHALKFPFVVSSTARPQSIRTDRRVSPPSVRPSPTSNPNHAEPRTGRPAMPLSYSAAAKNVWKQVAPSVPYSSPAGGAGARPPLPNKDPALAPLPPTAATMKNIQPPGKPPIFPYSSRPPVDPEVKYDVRSARGGRGGKVTSVANLWASGAITGTTSNDHASSNANGRSDFGRMKTKDVVVPNRLSAVQEDKVSSASTSAGVGGGVSASATSKPPPPAKPEKKLFSAAVMTPAPTRGPPLAAKPAAVPKPPAHNPEAPKRPDSRNLFIPPSASSSAAAAAAASKAPPPPPPGLGHAHGPKKVSSLTLLQPTTSAAAPTLATPPTTNGVHVSKPAMPSKPPSRSTDALVANKRPTGALPSSSSSNPYSLRPSGKVTPTPSGDPSPKQPAFKGLGLGGISLGFGGGGGGAGAGAGAGAKTAKPPPIAGLRARSMAVPDPAVVSSSHAVPTLSTTASLARPRTGASGASAAGGLPFPKANSKGSAVPLLGSTSLGGRTKVPVNSAAPEARATPAKVEESKEAERPPSPSKPTELAFGQARLRDLIRKYQGQGQRS